MVFCKSSSFQFSRLFWHMTLFCLRMYLRLVFPLWLWWSSQLHCKFRRIFGICSLPMVFCKSSSFQFSRLFWHMTLFCLRMYLRLVFPLWLWWSSQLHCKFRRIFGICSLPMVFCKSSSFQVSRLFCHSLLLRLRMYLRLVFLSWWWWCLWSYPWTHNGHQRMVQYNSILLCSKN